MQQYLLQIKQSKLFEEISDTDIISFLSCCNARVRKYKKEEIIFLAGNSIKQIGLVLEGNCHILKEDFWGNKHIVGILSPNEIFGEVFAIEEIPLEITVQAKTDTNILLINITNLINTCPVSCSFHSAIIKNLVKILSRKTLKMNQKLEHITRKTMKDKILSYLSSMSIAKNSKSFTIPFNRVELAEFLGVDRTALSKELSKLQKQGIISFKKNYFTLHEDY